MGELMNLDLDYQQLSAGFGGLSQLSLDLGTGPGPAVEVKPEEELTLLNISGNKPVMTTVNSPLNNINTVNYIQNALQTNPQNIDHLLQVIESQEKQNERMLIQYRLKQVLLDYLKTKQVSKNCQQSPAATGCAGAGLTATGSPSLCQQQNQSIHALDDQRLNAILCDGKGYPIGGQSPPLLTPPISPDIGQQFFLTNCQTTGEQQNSSPNLSYIGLNGSQELIESQELSESIERFYSSESEGQPNNHLTIDDEEDDFDDNNQSLFDEPCDYHPSAQTYSMASPPYATNSSPYNTSPIHVSSQTKRNTIKSNNNNRGRKASTVSAPGESSVQMQKRSAHLSAEFRYRTKLNDKISKLRNIVGPKSQLSKSGVLSRSIDLITKLQKSNSRLKEENKKIRLLLMQACNQPGNVNQNNMMTQ